MKGLSGRPVQCLSELRALLRAAGSSEPFIAVLQARPRFEIRQCWEKLTFSLRYGCFWGVLTSAVWEPPGGLLQTLGFYCLGF